MSQKYEVQHFIEQIEEVLKKAKNFQGIIEKLEEENESLKSQLKDKK